jgi:hypothetical protein
MNGFQKAIKVFAIFLAMMIILSIIRSVLFGLSIVTNFELESNSGKEFSETYQDVEKIDIEISSAHITIKTGAEFKVVATNIKNDFSSKLNKRTLKISDNQKWFNNKNNTKIILYVPDGKILEDFKINSGAGKVEIVNVVANNFNINQGAGLMKISYSKFNNINIEGGVGATEIISSILNNLNLETGVGSVDIEAEITGNSKIDCGVGKVNLLLHGNQDLYTISAKKGLGTIRINNEKQTIKNKAYVGGDNIIKINGGLGDINVNFTN